jgi:hypothetical protein
VSGKQGSCDEDTQKLFDELMPEIARTVSKVGSLCLSQAQSRHIRRALTVAKTAQLILLAARVPLAQFIRAACFRVH